MQRPEIPPLSSATSVTQLSLFLQNGHHMREIESISQRLRIPLKELFPKQLGDFAETGVNPQIQELRLEHYEQKRTFRLRKILEEVTGKGRRNRSQDITAARKHAQEHSPSPVCACPASISPLPVTDSLPASSPDVNEFSSTDVSQQEQIIPKRERLLQVQERALQQRLSDIAVRVKKLKEKEARFDHLREELKVAEAEKQRKREARNAKIRENLERKHKELEEFEKREARKGLRLTPEPKSVQSRCSFHFEPSRKCLRGEEDTERDIEERMGVISRRLEEGAERANQRRTLKALSLAAKIDQYRKTRQKLEERQRSYDQDKLDLLSHLKQQQDKSRRIRTERLTALTQKRSEGQQKRQYRATSNSQDCSVALISEEKESEKEGNLRLSHILKAEKSLLRRRDVEENRRREAEGLKEAREFILLKHQNLTTSAERRSQERASMDQVRLRMDFLSKAQREKLRKSMEGKMQHVQNRYFQEAD